MLIHVSFWPANGRAANAHARAVPDSFMQKQVSTGMSE